MSYLTTSVDIASKCMLGSGMALMLCNGFRVVTSSDERETDTALKQLALGIGVLAAGILVQMYSQLPPEPVVYTTLYGVLSATALSVGAGEYCFAYTDARRQIALKIMAIGFIAMMMELGLALSEELGEGVAAAFSLITKDIANSPLLLNINNMLEKASENAILCASTASGIAFGLNAFQFIRNPHNRENNLRHIAKAIGGLALVIFLKQGNFDSTVALASVGPIVFNFFGLCSVLLGACLYHHRNSTERQKKSALVLMGIGLAFFLLVKVMETTKNVESVESPFQKCSLDDLREAIKAGGGDQTLIGQMFKAVNKTHSVTCENFLPLRENCDLLNVEVPLHRMKHSVMWGLHPKFPGPFISITNKCDHLIRQVTTILQAFRNGNVVGESNAFKNQTMYGVSSACDLYSHNEDFLKRFVDLIETGTTLTLKGANITRI